MTTTHNGAVPRSPRSARVEQREEMTALLRRRDRERLTYARLSAMSGIPISTLAWWKRRLEASGPEARPRAGSSSTLRLFEVGAGQTPGSPASTAPLMLEVVLHNGRRLRAPVSIEPGTLGELISALDGPC